MKILVCTDFSTASAGGEREAALRFPDATLVIFHAVDDGLLRVVAERTGQDKERLREEMTNYADTRVDEVVARLRSQGKRAEADITAGEPADAALAAARRHGVHLIVMGVRAGERVGRFRTRMVRESRTPVLIIPGES